MVQVLVIVAFLSLHAGELVGSREAPFALDTPTALALMLAPLGVLWVLGHSIVVRAGRRLDTTGDRAFAVAAERAISLVRTLGGLGFASASSALGWGGLVRERLVDLPGVSELAGVLPILLFLAGGWWSIAPIERRMREARLLRDLREGAPVHRPPTRAEYVWANFRHQVMLVLIPLTLLSAWRGVLRRWGDHIPGLGWPSGDAGGWVRLAIDLLGVAVVFVITPVLIRLVWDTVPITSGSFFQSLTSMCQRYRVRMRTPLLWRTHGAMVNGAVLGLVWPFRYLMFTDALFDRLSARQVEGVAAHEVGHIRRRHILWLGVSVFAAVALGEWVGVLVSWAVHARERTLEGIVIATSVASVAFAFGWVSRRFEWQADAFAVQHLSRAGDVHSPHITPSDAVTRESIDAMTSALLDVAEINGINPHAFTFRHGSIATRVRRLRELEGIPVEEAPIDRQVRRLKWAAGVVLALAVGATFLLEWFGGQA